MQHDGTHSPLVLGDEYEREGVDGKLRRYRVTKTYAPNHPAVEVTPVEEK